MKNQSRESGRPKLQVRVQFILCDRSHGMFQYSSRSLIEWFG
jgi:hypothetical protein